LLTVFTQRNIVADFLQGKCTFWQKMAILHLWTPLWGLRGNAWCSSWAYWKGCCGLPICVNWPFSLVVTAEVPRANIDRKSAFLLQWDQFFSKFQSEGVVPDQPFLLSEN